MRSPMMAFPSLVVLALVCVTKGATAGFQTLRRIWRAPSLHAAVCDGGVNAMSVTGRRPTPALTTSAEVDLGPLYGVMRVVRVLRCRSLGRRGPQMASRSASRQQ